MASTGSITHRFDLTPEVEAWYASELPTHCEDLRIRLGARSAPHIGDTVSTHDGHVFQITSIRLDVTGDTHYTFDLIPEHD